MKTIFIIACVSLFSIGCDSTLDISSEIVCGKWDMYLVDTGHNGKEQKQPVIYTFLSDGSFVCRVEEGGKGEISSGKWEIKEEKLFLFDTANNSAVYSYRKGQSHTFTYTAYEEKFFPKGLTFILRKQ